MSYAPFRDEQDPLVEGTRVDAQQIDEDLTLLSRYTDCVRTYSIENGQDQIAAIAQRHGMKVLQGIWLSNNADENRQQIATAVALAKKFPDVIRAIIVGNEVLLRGDMSVTDLETAIREVKAQVSHAGHLCRCLGILAALQRPAKLRRFRYHSYPAVLGGFSDSGVAAAAHVDDIRKKVAAAIPNKEIVIGEFGWPSEGRMREGALPSPSNQARVIEKRWRWRSAKIFASMSSRPSTSPGSASSRGATGGYWGIFDRATGAPKFSFDGTVSDHPHWLDTGARRHSARRALVLPAPAVAGRGKGRASLVVAADRGADRLFPPCCSAGRIERIPIDSFTAGGWLRSLAFAARPRRRRSPAPRLRCGPRAPTFAALMSRSSERARQIGSRGRSSP